MFVRHGPSRRFPRKQMFGFFFFLSPPEEATCVPAEIRGEDVEELVPVYQRVEDGAVGAIDHVALFRGPPCHLPIVGRGQQK